MADGDARGGGEGGGLIAVLDSEECDVEEAELRRQGVEMEVVAFGVGEGDRELDTVSSVDLERVVVAFAWHTVSLNARVLAKMPRLEGIVRLGTGYDNVDLAAAGDRVRVSNVPNYGTEEVADTALWHILSCYRRTAYLCTAVAGGACFEGADRIAEGAVGAKRLRGEKLGILGFGRIGSALGRRAAVLGMDVGFFDPYVREGEDKVHGVRRYESLEEMLRSVGCLSVHCSLTAETRDMVGWEELGWLGEGAVVVNTARGGVVQEAALRRRLEEGRIGAVGLDVHEKEPFSWEDPAQPLGSSLPQALRARVNHTPHSAWFSEQSKAEMRTLAAKEAARMCKRLPLRACVNA